MIDYTDYKDVLSALKSDQEADYDRREAVREVKDFLHKKDGQWEPSIIAKLNNRPRYTFDQCNPIVDQHATEIENMDFGIEVLPMDAEGSEDRAEVLAGMIRSIEARSKAQDMVYKPAVRSMVESGFDAWEVVQDWAESEDAFDQDLFIRKIPNASDSVFFDQSAVLQDMSDAEHVNIVKPISKSRYKAMFPDGKMRSVSVETSDNSYSYKPENVVKVGRLLYKKRVPKEIVQMTDGRVYEVNDDYEKIKDELADVGILEERRRKIESIQVYSRMYDGDGWLTKEEKTVFKSLPVIPIYGNFSIDEGKVIYQGAVERLMDAQRVYNYAESRQVEDIALSPKTKTWMTREQAEGNEQQLRTLNTNADPVQFYNHVATQPPPFNPGGTRPDPGLQNISNNMRQNIMQSGGMFSANMGDNPGLQSGIAIERLQDAGNSSADKYINSTRIAIGRTFEVLAQAIPVVYDAKRTAFIMGEDGVGEVVTLHERIFDEESQTEVTVNDLSKGRYQVSCKVGPSFRNRKEKTNAALLEMAAIKPDLLDLSGDILLRNTGLPGMDDVADRVRVGLVNAGVIPQDQLTDEEIAAIQAQQEAAASQPDPTTMLVQIESQKAADQAADNQAKRQIEVAKVENERLKIGQQAAKDRQQLALQADKHEGEQEMLVIQMVNELINGMAQLREAMGVDVAVGPEPIEAFAKQAQAVTDKQEDAGFEDVGSLANRPIQ